jgi:hypothetical protein
MKTIKTEEFLNQQVWDMMVKERTDNPRFFQAHALDPRDIIDPNNKLKCSLNEHMHKYYSQAGEEGIVEYIFSKIGYTNKMCVELGANDGKLFSNTLYFKEKHGFQRKLIEGNSSIKNITGEDTTYSVITPGNINELLSDCPKICDFISIDFDGDDYWVWKEMKTEGRVVLAEYHTALPNDIPLAIIPGKGGVYDESCKETLEGYMLANLRAFYELAEKKGYKFCTTIGCNALFVLKEEFNKLEIPEISLEECIERYFCPMPYWWLHRDKSNREWIIPE